MHWLAAIWPGLGYFKCCPLSQNNVFWSDIDFKVSYDSISLLHTYRLLSFFIPFRTSLYSFRNPHVMSCLVVFIACCPSVHLPVHSSTRLSSSSSSSSSTSSSSAVGNCHRHSRRQSWFFTNIKQGDAWFLNRFYKYHTALDYCPCRRFCWHFKSYSHWRCRCKSSNNENVVV